MWGLEICFLKAKKNNADCDLHKQWRQPLEASCFIFLRVASKSALCGALCGILCNELCGELCGFLCGVPYGVLYSVLYGDLCGVVCCIVWRIAGYTETDWKQPMMALLNFELWEVEFSSRMLFYHLGVRNASSGIFSF